MSQLNFLSLPQLVTAEHRQKREDETSTVAPAVNYLDQFKTGIENMFSEQNVRKAVGAANDLGDKVKDLGSKVFTNVQNAFKSDSTPAPTTAA